LLKLPQREGDVADQKEERSNALERSLVLCAGNRNGGGCSSHAGSPSALAGDGAVRPQFIVFFAVLRIRMDFFLNSLNRFESDLKELFETK
jgi:hypothetical protein